LPEPTFFIVGAPKCGTTAMKEYLRAHPGIFMPALSEINHFADDLLAKDDALLSRSNYLRLFDDARPDQLAGEKSVFHLYSNRATSTIKKFCADARIIIMLRNPVDMLYSLHAQLMFNGEEDIRDFGAALAADGHRPHNNRLRIKTAHWYKKVGNFSEQVQRYFDVFGRDRVLVVIYEDLRRNTPQVYRATLEFLGVDPDFRPDFGVVNANRELRSLTLHRFLIRLPRTSLTRRLLPPRVHQQLFRGCSWLQQFNTVSKPRPAMDPQLRCSLIREYEPEIQRLSALLRADLGSWLQQDNVLPLRVA
jgi:hypothetical protein